MTIFEYDSSNDIVTMSRERFEFLVKHLRSDEDKAVIKAAFAWAENKGRDLYSFELRAACTNHPDYMEE